MKFIQLLICISALLAPSAHAETLIVGNKYEHTVSFVDLATGTEVMRQETGRAPHEIAVSPDGTRAVVASYRDQGYEGQTLHVFDVLTARKTGVIDLGKFRAPHGLKWIGDSPRLMATVEASEAVVVVDTALGKVSASVHTGQRGSHLLAITPDKTRAFVANIGSGTVTAIDLKTLAKIADIDAGSGAEAIAVTPDGKQFWAGANTDRTVTVFDALSFEKVHQFKTQGVPIRIEFHPDGQSVAVSEFDLDRVSVYDTQTYGSLASTELSDHSLQTPVTLLFSPSGDRLWVAATHSARIAEINTSDWSVGRIFEVGEGSDGLGYSPLSMALPQRP